MLTLSKPISAGQAQAYHKSEFANAKENYYTEGERVRGEWQGQLAERYGLRGEVNEEQFARLSRRPASADRRGSDTPPAGARIRQRARRNGAGDGAPGGVGRDVFRAEIGLTDGACRR